MREGVNPEKAKSEKNPKYYHRIIIPIYIPNTLDDYYKQSIEVLTLCLKSLFSTINPTTTAISIINNASCSDVQILLDKFLTEERIDKTIIYKENKGKVYTVLSEAKASYEAFITIVDADVIFFQGWEKAVFKIFENIPKSGVVSPLPLQNLAFHKNNSVFFDHYFSGNIEYSKEVLDEDCELFLKGMGNSALLNRTNKKYSWKERQYVLTKGGRAIVGAGHFVATYRKEIFQDIVKFPEMKFLNGYEENFLDDIADKLGWYRLSTLKTFAYHMGNRIEALNYGDNQANKIEAQIFEFIKTPKITIVPFIIRKNIFRALKKWKKL